MNTIVNYYLLVKKLIETNDYNTFIKFRLNNAFNEAKLLDRSTMPYDLLEAKEKMLMDLIRSKGIIYTYIHFKKFYLSLKALTKGKTKYEEYELEYFELLDKTAPLKTNKKSITEKSPEITQARMIESILELCSESLNRFVVSFAALKLRNLYLTISTWNKNPDENHVNHIKAYITEFKQSEITEFAQFAHLGNNLLRVSVVKYQKTIPIKKEMGNLIAEEIINRAFSINDIEERLVSISETRTNFDSIQRNLENTMKYYSRTPEVYELIKIMLSILKEIKEELSKINFEKNNQYQEYKLTKSNNQTKLY